MDKEIVPILLTRDQAEEVRTILQNAAFANKMKEAAKLRPIIDRVTAAIKAGDEASQPRPLGPAATEIPDRSDDD